MVCACRVFEIYRTKSSKTHVFSQSSTVFPVCAAYFKQLLIFIYLFNCLRYCYVDTYFNHYFLDLGLTSGACDVTIELLKVLHVHLKVQNV